MNDVDRNVLISSLEIAQIVLDSKGHGLPWVEDILSRLDISDEEAEILLQRIEEYMNEDI